MRHSKARTVPAVESRNGPVAITRRLAAVVALLGTGIAGGGVSAQAPYPDCTGIQSFTCTQGSTILSGSCVAGGVVTSIAGPFPTLTASITVAPFQACNSIGNPVYGYSILLIPAGSSTPVGSLGGTAGSTYCYPPPWVNGGTYGGQTMLQYVQPVLFGPNTTWFNVVPAVYGPGGSTICWNRAIGPFWSYWPCQGTGYLPYGQSGTGANSLLIHGVTGAGGVRRIVTDGAQPFAAGALVLASAPASLAALGGTLLVDPGSMLLLPAAADAAGRHEFSAAIPPQASGLTVFIQSGFLDPSQPGGLALSHGLQVVL